MSEGLRGTIPKEMITVPEFFDVFDVRKPPKQWVEDKMMHILQLIFEARSKVEKTLTRRELIAYDHMLTRFLLKDELMPRLRAEVDSAYN